MEVIEANNFMHLETLITHGVNLNELPALRKAVEPGHEPVVKTLIESKISINVNINNNELFKISILDYNFGIVNCY